MARRTNLREDFNVPEIRHRKDDSLVTETRSYKVITPLFGGGVEAGVNDPVTPIRGTSVRGQLRFWWRACKGRQFSSVEEMKEREDLIWGSATDADSEKNDRSVLPVSLFVRTQQKTGTKFDRKNWYSNPKDVLSYVGFPLRSKERQINLKKDIVFDLTLTYETEFENDVHAALWAWETFGGIGARTRRGFGQLECLKVSIGNDVLADGIDSIKSVESLNSYIDKYCSRPGKNRISEIPLIPDNFNDTNCVFVGNFSFPIDAWESIVGYLKKFRHQTDKGNNANKSNRWPEAASIKNAVVKDQKENNDGKSTDEPDPTYGFIKFPRAAFGLPIIFNESEKLFYWISDKKNEERFGSPLFMSVVKIKNKYSGLIVIMDNCSLPLNSQLLLISPKFKDGCYMVSHNLSEIQAKELKVSKNGVKQPSFLSKKDGKVETDVLKAFINYVKNEEMNGVNKT